MNHRDGGNPFRNSTHVFIPYVPKKNCTTKPVIAHIYPFFPFFSSSHVLAHRCRWLTSADCRLPPCLLLLHRSIYLRVFPIVILWLRRPLVLGPGIKNLHCFALAMLKAWYRGVVSFPFSHGLALPTPHPSSPRCPSSLAGTAAAMPTPASRSHATHTGCITRATSP